MALDGVLGNLPLLLVIAGFVLMVLEALAPGAHFIVLGVALLAAGLVGMAVGGPLASALALAGMVLFFGAAALFVYREFDFYEGSEAGRTKDSNSLRGQSGRVVEQVTPTEGRVKLDAGGFNPYYQARSMDGEIEEGEEVMVIDPGGGNVVTVESVGEIESDLERELQRAEAESEAEREAVAEEVAEEIAEEGRDGEGTEDDDRDTDLEAEEAG